MKKLTIGTTNEAKVKQIKGALMPLGIQVDGLPKTIALPTVIEDGKTAEENGRKKALAYSKAIGQKVLSMDNALYLDGLPENEQPGLNVRRIPNSNERPSDDELLAYYSMLIHRLGGKVKGHWEFAVCIADVDGTTQETTIISERFFVEKPSTKIVKGYPLESLQIDPVSGKYISDMNQEEQDRFWQTAIGHELCDFVAKSSKMKISY